MDIDRFLEPTILIVSGKGGVGKTTIAAALALVAARSGRRVCIAEIDRKGSMAKVFGGGDLGYQPREMSPNVWGINIEPGEALAEYLDVQYRMRRLSWAFTSTHFLDMITTAAPGFKDILILGKVWYLEQGRTLTESRHHFDNIVVDAPAAGHMLSFLQSPIGLADAVRVGPIQRQARWLVEMITDPARARVHLVTLPEEMPVTETLETAGALRDKIGIDPGAIFANGVYSQLFSKKELKRVEELTGPLADDLIKAGTEAGADLDSLDVTTLASYESFLESRIDIQQRHLRALKRGTVEDVVELPFLFSARLDLPQIETLADAIEEKVAAL